MVKILEGGIDITWKTVLKTIGVIALIFVIGFFSFAAGVNLTWQVAFKKGYKEGYETSLEDVRQLLSTKNIDLQWTELENGRYRIEIRSITTGELLWTGQYEMHLLVQLYRPYEYLSYYERLEADSTPVDSYHWLYWYDINGNNQTDFPYEYKFLIDETYHALTTVDQGKDWIEQQYFNPNASQKALYFAMSNDSSSVSTSWTTIPNEITDGGLARAQATYYDNGTGAAILNHTFSITTTKSTKLYAVYYDAYNSIENSLVAAEQQGVANQKNMNDGDSLKMTVSWSLTN